MATARRVKIPAAPIYNDKEEADRAIARIAQLQRDRTSILDVTRQQIDALTEDARVAVGPIDNEIKELVQNLSVYAEYNRAELTNDGRTKLVSLAHGSLQWRFTPFAVSIRGKTEVVIQRLKKLGLTQFIRTKETIDRQAMSKNRMQAEAVEGISFTRREEFVVTPNETNIETAPVTKTVKPKAPDVE